MRKLIILLFGCFLALITVGLTGSYDTENNDQATISKLSVDHDGNYVSLDPDLGRSVKFAHMIMTDCDYEPELLLAGMAYVFADGLPTTKDRPTGGRDPPKPIVQAGNNYT
jgi:hypothetical protein